MSKVIIVTGAGRGLGTDIAREALDAGHKVVATGRRPEEVEKTLGGPQDNLLSIRLDITNLEDAHTAVQAAVERFGRIDVLVNDAGNFFAGYFEEISPEYLRQRIETNLFGPMNVTRAVLPVLRNQRAGHVITISSVAGVIGQEFCAAYAASRASRSSSPSIPRSGVSAKSPRARCRIGGVANISSPPGCSPKPAGWR